MKTKPAKVHPLQETLERKEAELLRVLRNRDEMVIEQSADQLDQIQYSMERDLAIRNVDRDSKLLREIRAALLRTRDGQHGICIDCESVISPQRLAAVPWALCCIQCQEAADRGENDRPETLSETLVGAE